MRGSAYEKGHTGGQYSFAQIPSVETPRSQFDRSHGHKTAFDAGYLVPIFVDEALPGDTFNLKMSSFARLSTPIFPIMDNMFMDFFFFAVPNRLLWQNWEKFCGAQDNPGDSTDFTIPVTNTHAPDEGSLSDYMGMPLSAGLVEASLLPFRAYNRIWNDWFRDENMQTRATVNIGDGPENIGSYPLRRRGKRHDYFTSCLPFTQKGTAVAIPIGDADVIAEGTGEPRWDVGTGLNRALASDTSPNASWAGSVSNVAAVWNDPALKVDGASAALGTINELREAFQIQKMLERDARGGTRYTEILRSHFGVVSPDERMQRPEYLGGGSSRINIHPVAATTGGGTSEDVGTLAGFGTQSADGIGFVKSFTEHCVILGLVSVRADLTYQQGLERMWSRSTRYDFYWPSLAHLGEQAVLNKEIYHQGIGDDDLAFGYQERYAEYRYKPSRVSGILRSIAGGSLDSWHLALDFASLPALNSTFIQDQPPLDRCVQVPSEPHFIGDFYFNYKCARPMPTFSVPGLIDHF